MVCSISHRKTFLCLSVKMEISYILVCFVAILAIGDSAILMKQNSTNPFIKKLTMNQYRTGFYFDQFDTNNDDVITRSEMATGFSKKDQNTEQAEFVPALSQESLCFLGYFPHTTCPNDELYFCIIQILQTSYFLSIKAHIGYLETEFVYCSESSKQDQCVHREILSCTQQFNFLDAYEDFSICQEVPKTKECLADIKNKCTYSTFRTEGMFQLVSDRVNVAASECRIGYYQEELCSRNAILSCLKDFIEHGSVCRSTYLGTATRCLMAAGNRCQTGPAQVLAHDMLVALNLRCRY